ncbi:MAG: hypothetical protein E7672_09135 [Ruminococcaceae bacterium]|nr:hypothetical protein [Oscillospiraceae bacterium]
MDIEIYPTDKIVIDGKEIRFGMPKDDVERLIGNGNFVNTKFVKNRCYYFNNEMSVDYGDELFVCAVEFLGGSDGKLKPIIFGVSAFETDAEELFRLLCEKNGRDAEDNEGGYSYSFHEISVGIYREITPDDVEEMAEEMRENGILPENNPDFVNDRRRASHWAALCVGKSGYYGK